MVRKELNRKIFYMQNYSGVSKKEIEFFKRKKEYFKQK